MILKVENLVKNYGKHEVLKNISFSIEEPGIYALIGPNGSGKTTMFNVISNLLKKTSGDIEVVGKKNTDPSIFYEVSFLKDNRVLYDYLTGYDHLAFIRSVQKLPKERIDEVIDKLKISKYMDKRVGDYSLGMKQNLLIAMAMLNKPKLMILDEPLNGLDPTAVINVRKLFKDLVEEGTAILISSHTLSEIDLLTDNVMFLKDGKILEEKTDHSKENIYEIFFKEEDSQKLLTLDNNKDREIEIEDDKIIVNLKDEVIGDLLNDFLDKGIKILDIKKKKIGTEERYLEIFSDSL